MMIHRNRSVTLKCDDQIDKGVTLKREGILSSTIAIGFLMAIYFII